MNEASLLTVAGQRLAQLNVPGAEAVLQRLGSVLTAEHTLDTDRRAHKADLTSSDPGTLGRLRWELLSGHQRKSEGAFYTPPAVAAELANASVRACLPDRVCDPAMGGGVFLLATADAMVAAGVSPSAAFEAMHGVDIDPISV
ncbi:MAG: N-6 DNA methylase, partial [Acidimicrobiales bacterium]